MTYVCRGVVKDNTIVLDRNNVRLPDGTMVEVHVNTAVPQDADSQVEQDDPFEALLKRRSMYEGRRIDIDEIIEEEKQDREERFDHWLFPNG